MSDSLTLFPRHRSSLEGASGISAEVIEARAYRTVETKAELKTLGFADGQRRVPALLLPIYNVHGEISLYQLRPDDPRIRDGKAIKYETPSGAHMAVDCHPLARRQLSDPTLPLWITEGVKKADALVTRNCCALALLGVWNWRGTNKEGGKTALPDWESVALNRRPVYIVFDSDVMVKAPVHTALTRLSEFLRSREAQVSFIYLPSGESGAKIGVDDFLAQGHTLDDLLALASPILRELPQSERNGATDLPYRVSESGLIYEKPTRDGTLPVPLTNFAARITADICEDDGVEQVHRFEVEAKLHGQSRHFVVPAAQFASMSWPMEQLGAQAIVFPGMGIRDHARAAIQILSPDMEKRRVYAHLGWRRIEEHGWCYLHAGQNGPIGPNGPVPEITIALSSELRRYQLPDPLEGKTLRAAIQSSLGLLDLGPGRIMTPLYAAIWAPLVGDPAFTIFLAGKTGVFKSELAALVQQHYGAELNAHHLPASWMSTANALQGLAFQAKDALLVVDDFAPTGSQSDIQRLHHCADVLLRGQGNRAGRQRMRPDASLRPSKPSRCLMLATGEDLPKGESLQARLCVIEVSKGDIDRQRLSTCQWDAAAGSYAAVLSSFVHWLAPQYETIRSTFGQKVTALRDQTQYRRLHQRTPQMTAHLGISLRMFLDFVVESGALPSSAVDDLWQSSWADLQEAARRQAEHQGSSDPVKRFRDLLLAVVTAGHAHVASMQGESPGSPGQWGWQGIETRFGMTWRPQGSLIGWIDEDAGWLYLEPQASYAAVQRLAHDMGEPLSLTARTLRKRLKEAGWLLTESSRSDHLTMRVQIDGCRRDALAISLRHLMSEQPDQPDQKVIPLSSGLVVNAEPDHGATLEPDQTLLPEINLDEA